MVSLLSSGWDQVVPTCSGRQAIFGCKKCVSTVIRYDPRIKFTNLIRATLSNKALSDDQPQHLIGCYMVKSHGQLVLVS